MAPSSALRHEVPAFAGMTNRVMLATALRPFERSPFAEQQAVARDAHAFLLEVVRHRGAEAGVGDPVHRPGLDRLVAAGELVAALRARLDPREAALDREVD